MLIKFEHVCSLLEFPPWYIQIAVLRRYGL